MELSDVKGIGSVTLEKLKKLNITSTLELLMLMPSKYIKLTPVPISEIREGYFYTVKATVAGITKKVKLKNMKLFSVEAKDDKGEKIEISWFNQDYISKIIRIDVEYIFYGKAVTKQNKICILNPEFEQADQCKKLRGIRVEYSTKGLLSSTKVSGFIKQIIDKEKVTSLISDETASKYGITSFNEALYNIHFPTTENDLVKNIDRITLEKIINTMLVYNRYRCRLVNKRSFHYKYDFSVLNNCISRLPYKLTDSQENALKVVTEKLKSENTVNYLLLGDVGSGKTIVAMLLCYYAVLSEGKAVMLVPSETLLNQHYESAGFLSRYMRIAKLSAGSTGAERQAVLNGLEKGEIDLLIGTHALLNENIALDGFTFAVIDEQQKFGVNQKGGLLKKLANADCLLLSATPIPRAINLMFNNELNAIEIYKPESKKTHIETKLVGNEKLTDMLRYIAEKAEHNEKSFVVCPNIEGGAAGIGVNEIYDILTKRFNAKAAMINGRLSEEDKCDAMHKFKDGEYNILVATTIIEVGIDVQNAKNMVVVNSERFGLSALHQLRGRVGRNGEKAFCFLHYDNLTESAKERLKILKNYNDGFMISKLDYRLRGGGDIYGSKQSGKVGNLIESDMLRQDLISMAQLIYEEIIKSNKTPDMTQIYNSELLYSKIGDIVLA